MHGNGRTRPIRPASGIAAWRPAAGARPPATRWAGWAHRIISRHRAGRGHWTWVATILARPRPTLRATIATIRWPISLTVHAAPLVSFPRAAMTMAPVAAAPASDRPLPAGTGAALPPRSPLLRVVARRGFEEGRRLSDPGVQRSQASAGLPAGQIVSRTEESALVARLTARRQRQEIPSASALPPTGGIRPSPPPGTVVTRARPATREEATPTPLRGMGSPVMDSAAPSRPPLAGIDVEGLADQVIRTIDQRVIAARERLGAR